MKIDASTRKYEKQFSFGSLVTSMIEFEEMKKSFIDAGFTEEDCEYLYIDNTNGNSMCGYQGLNEVLIQAKGKYIILLHQDIRSFDNRSTLESKIKEMDGIDSDWGLLGTAGGSNFGNFTLIGVDTKGSTIKYGTFPSKVSSIDEVFIIVKKDARLSFSHDLTGFHYYGTDICTIADILGYGAYVIDFRHIHKGSNTGRRFDFFECQNRMLRKYGRALRDREIQAACNIVYLTGQKMRF